MNPITSTERRDSWRASDAGLATDVRRLLCSSASILAPPFAARTIPRVRNILLAVVATGIAATASSEVCAAAPLEITEPTVYEETRNPPRLRDYLKILLLPSGELRGIVYDRQTLQPPSVPSARVPQNGRWQYRRLTTNTGELIFVQGTTTFTRTLTFQTAIAGTLGLGSDRFRLISPVSPPLINASNRAFLLAGGSVSTGFVLTEGARLVLVRAIGPGLQPFGVTNPVREIALNIRDGAGLPVRTDADDDLVAVSAAVGAFPMRPGDVAFLVRLSAGAYTATVRASDDTASGEVLIEVYLL